MSYFRNQKPITFILPGIFLLILGIGNLIVGHFKGSQYEKVLLELSVEKSGTALLNNASPMRRIQYEKTTTNRLDERQNKARARKDFYILVSLGGKLFVGLALLLFSIGLIVEISSKQSIKNPKRLSEELVNL